MEAKEKTLFLPSFLAHIPNDQLVFVSCLLSCYPLGIFYRTLLHPKRATATTRHAVGLLLGVIFGWISYKWQFFIILGMSFSCYVMTLVLNPKFVHRYVFAFALFILSFGHLYRQLTDYGGYKLDFTGPIMIVVQRVTYVSLNVHDGQGRDEKDLSAEQKKEQLKKVPSLLEYLGYILHYSTLLAGPACTYREYKDFIDGTAFVDKDIKRKDPSPLVPVLEKSITSLLCLALFFTFAPSFSPILNADEEFIASHSFLWRLFFAWFSMVVTRMRYYFAFKGAEAVNNLSGLGFSGYNENGKPIWNSILHANILKVEFPLNMKMIFDNWNISTSLWLRRCVYDRLTKHRTLAVFSLSAAWHGFYGGYYLTFTGAQLFLEAARAFRRVWRERFQKTVLLSRVYDVMTCFITAISLGYLTVPFVLLDPWQGLRFWRSLYFCGHILGIIILLLHRGKGSRSQKSKSSETTSTAQETIQNGLMKPSVGEEKNAVMDRDASDLQ